MFSREERIAARDKGQKIRKEILADRDEIIARRMDRFAKEYAKIEGEIKDLQDRRGELLCGAVTKAEILSKAKSSLRDGKENLIKSLLAGHIGLCQASNLSPFGGATLNVKMLHPDAAWKLFFFAVSESDIEAAVALLPDIGMSMAEREAKIEEIDLQISALQKTMKDDLAVEKRLK